jgi:hypothetical protein
MQKVRISNMPDELTLSKHKNEEVYVIGDFKTEKNKTSFVVYLKIDLMKEVEYANQFGYKNLYQVINVVTQPSIRGRGLAIYMYKWLVKKQKYVILGDTIQYFGARVLWSKLSKAVDVTVDVIDVVNGNVISNNAVLHQGKFDEDFDEEIWSYTFDKVDILLVLKDINL